MDGFLGELSVDFSGVLIVSLDFDDSSSPKVLNFPFSAFSGPGLPGSTLCADSMALVEAASAESSVCIVAT